MNVDMTKMNPYMILLGLVVLLLCHSCIVGENDEMTLISRKKRLTGTWTLSSYNISYTSVNDTVVNNSLWSYNGDTIRITQSDNSTSATFYKEKMIFGKNGDFRVDITDYAQTTSEIGYWYWTEKNNDVDIKAREVVFIWFGDTIGGQQNVHTGFSVKHALLLDKLTKTEMDIKIDNTITYPDGRTYSEKGKMSYRKE